MNLKKINNFRLSATSNFYLLQGKEKEFNYSDGIEEERYILESISSSNDISSSSDELSCKIKNWSSKYHLTKERANIIRAVELKNKKKLKVIEIGGGCGAITRYLGEEFGEVHSIEGSPFRSKIISERCKDLDNVEVYCANVFDIELPKDYYDLVVLVGVLEYSNVFSGIENNPVKSSQMVLKFLSSALKKDGNLILAIENKFGLKYFSGASEDHTGIKFDSIQGYSKHNTPVTYSRNELSQIILNAGFKTQEWIYPFPDYKLPTVFISEKAAIDNSIYTSNWIETPFTDSGTHYKPFFNEALAIREIIKAGMLPNMSNSFLIHATKANNLPKQQWLIKKINTQRHKNLCSEIQLVKNNETLKIVRKRAFNNCIGNEISSKLYVNTLKSEPYVYGNLLSWKLFLGIVNKTIEEDIIDTSKTIIKLLKEEYSDNGFDSDGFEILKSNAIDITFWNVIQEESGTLKVIDLEWEQKITPVTIDYVLYRSIHHFLNKFSLQLFDGNNENMEILEFKILSKLFSNFTEARFENLKKMEIIFLRYVTSMDENNIESFDEKTTQIILTAEKFIEDGNLYSAKSILEEVLIGNPDNIEALNDYAVLLILMNEKNSAQNAINYVLNLDPQNEVAIGNLQYLEENL